MAKSFNKVVLVGRLVDEQIKIHNFNNGGGVAQFTIAVNNRVKDRDTGEWKDEGTFLDMKLFSRGEDRKNIEIFTQYVRKGNQVLIEGHLKQEKWQTPEGENRYRLLIYVDNFQILEAPRGEESNAGGGGYQDDYGAGDVGGSSRKSAPASQESSNYSGGGGADDDIPF